MLAQSGDLEQNREEILQIEMPSLELELTISQAAFLMDPSMALVLS